MSHWAEAQSRQKPAHIKKDTRGIGELYKEGYQSKLHTCERVLTSSAS